MGRTGQSEAWQSRAGHSRAKEGMARQIRAEKDRIGQRKKGREWQQIRAGESGGAQSRSRQDGGGDGKAD